ncbi:MAG: 1-acyl-sn-glycerol-3-phosphate acyltransferase [Bacteroidales bacterium]|nr:1-acyl-sn-glycerol-3-phosphate acyltransferase [Bacteroidales bacterium]
MSRWAKFCGWLLRKMGWTSVGGPCPEDKAIILGVPHTSIWDFLVSYLFYAQFGKKAKVMIKKEFFFWPMGPLLRKLGGVPTDRTNAAAMVKGLIDEMERDDSFILAIAPEGTRKPVKKWKTGYHTIAKAVNCPVYLGYFDWGRKRVGRGEIFQLTDNAREDTDKIQAIYETMGLKGKHPKGYITH